jgi:hypothetical protein
MATLDGIRAIDFGQYIAGPPLHARRAEDSDSETIIDIDGHT